MWVFQWNPVDETVAEEQEVQGQVGHVNDVPETTEVIDLFSFWSELFKFVENLVCDKDKTRAEQGLF